ncbi:hypothetical protein [Bathymodiolus platifrons methanotrophic gill symbiont]|uniref:hypothetical protein n=1 Tax=Bathymodiolus platifrons methanotrophic gill symbiont TaxID=113268 RepID=UPI00142E2F5E|nr:hypothetical protein [Bathymodiolus platifrons methanotrophic gill symbiont]
MFVFKACPVLDPGIIITGDTDTSVLQNIQKEGLLMLSKPVTPKLKFPNNYLW